MLAGGILFSCAVVVAIIAVLRPVSGPYLLAIQTLAFLFALSGIIILARGYSSPKM
jgi:hypothetical protein